MAEGKLHRILNIAREGTVRCIWDTLSVAGKSIVSRVGNRVTDVYLKDTLHTGLENCIRKTIVQKTQCDISQPQHLKLFKS